MEYVIVLFMLESVLVLFMLESAKFNLVMNFCMVIFGVFGKVNILESYPL